MRDRQRLLIVEDSPYLLKLYSEEFEEGGYLVMGCLNGLEALQLVEKDKDFDLIVLDARLPMMDGIEFCRAVKKHLSDVPVIVNTAYDHLENEFKDAGVNEYIVKSSDLSTLKDLVRKLSIKPDNKSSEIEENILRCYDYFNCSEDVKKECLAAKEGDWRCWMVSGKCLKRYGEDKKELPKDIICAECEYFLKYKDQ